jgi:hypothetical protein
MAIKPYLHEKAKMTPEDGGVSLAMRVSFAQDMFLGVNLEEIGI